MAARRSYSDEEKAEALAALAANNGDDELTAQQTGIPASNLRAWSGGRGIHPAAAQQCEKKKASLAERLEDLAHQCVGMLPDKLKAASAKDVAVVLGISVEKAQLLQGKPTEIQEQQSSPDERRARIAELLGRGEDRARAALPDAGGAGGSGPAAPGAVAN